MKIKSIIIFVLLFVVFESFAQEITEKSSKKKPLWFQEKPQSDDYSYFIGVGEDNSLLKAKAMAVADVLQQLSNQAGVTISSETNTKISNKTVNENINTTIEFEAEISGTGEKIKISGLRKEEDYYQRRGTKYEYWVLMRKPKKDADPIFDIKQSYGATALWRSAILPGWGQMYKKQKIKAYTLIASEVILLSGALISQNQYDYNYNEAIKNMKNANYLFYLDKADTWTSIRNMAFVGAGAFYIYNLIDAVASKGAKRYAYYKPKNYKIFPNYNKFGYQLTFVLNF